MKTCKKCHIQQPLTSFYTCKNTSSGLRGSCKTCTKIETDVWRANNHERRTATNAAYSIAHRDQLKAWYAAHPNKRKEYSAAWRAANPDKKTASAAASKI